MEKITRKQFDKLNFKGRGIEINKKLLELNINQGLIVEKKDYPFKQKLCLYVGSKSYNRRSLLYGKKFKSRTLKDDKGWAILRIK